MENGDARAAACVRFKTQSEMVNADSGKVWHMLYRRSFVFANVRKHHLKKYLIN